MIIIPHFANANGNLEKHLAKIQRAVDRVEKTVVPKLKLTRQIDISFAAIPQFIILEDHVGGRTYTSEYIQITVDPKSKDIPEEIFFEIISHELAHAARWSKNSEYMQTLFDGLISEGLATAFEEVVVRDNHIKNPQFFLKTVIARTDSENEKILKNLINELDNEFYDYETIFFDGNDSLPRWSGYSLGLYLVKKYLKQTNQTITEVLADKYSDFRRVIK